MIVGTPGAEVVTVVKIGEGPQSAGAVASSAHVASIISTQMIVFTLHELSCPLG